LPSQLFSLSDFNRAVGKMMLHSTPARGLFSSLILLGLLALQTVAIVTTGATDNCVQQRREIRDLISDKTSWYLYIQAMAQLQSVDQSNIQGYYQLAGML
jgi:hypothetical protein